MPIPLAMDYDMVAETALGTAAVPLGTMTPLTLVALAFVTGELDNALSGKSDDLLATTWEAAITARGAQAATGGAAVNARAAAMAARTSTHDQGRTHGRPPRGGKRWRGAVGCLVKGTAAGQYGRRPGNARPFKRLARLADAHGRT